VLDEYLHEFIGSTFIANRITRSHLFDHLVAATPGLKEIMTLGQIWRWEQERSEAGKPRFDLIIVDAPATGHGVSLLRVPQVLIDMIRIGPIAEQTQVVDDLLHDRQKTSLLLVTIPEELPVNEAIEFYTVASETLNMPVAVTFINGVYPKTFTQREAGQFERLIKSHGSQAEGDGDLMLPLLESAKTAIVRRELQEFYMNRLCKAETGQVVEIPFYFTNELSVTETKTIAELLLRKLTE
jgi:anion-transporting  ArsA/GET3 family ATPase